MNRQYIGARYVPKFMGTYDPTQLYEALSVVDNGSGTSYISKVPVPVGTPLTDSDYWAIYGASSGAIINLQAQVDVLKTDMLTAQSDIESLETDVDDAETDIANLQSDVNNLNPRVKALERNIIVIGNSYVGTTGNQVAKELEECFKNAYEYHGGGAGFVAYTDHSTVFEDYLDDAIADSAFNNDTITDIIFVSAMGDTRAYTENNSNYITALETTLNSIKNKVATNFPNCKFISITLAETRNTAYWSNNPYSAIYAMHRNFNNIAYKHGIRYIGWSGWNSMFVADDTQVDNFHPSAIGARKIGAWIKASYFGHAEYALKHTSSTTLPFNYSNGSTCTLVADITPDETHVDLRRISMIAGNVITSQGSVLVDTSSLSFPLPAPSTDMEGYDNLQDANNGNSAEWLYVTVRGDSHGVMNIVNRRNPSVSTVGAGTYCLPPLYALSYKNTRA